MLMRIQLIFVITLLTLINICNGDLCEFSFCKCEDSDVLCQGDEEDPEDLVISSSVLPSQITSLSLSNLARVTVKTDTFVSQQQLKEIHIKSIEKVEIKKFSFSSSNITSFSSLLDFRLDSVNLLEFESSHSLDNLPKMNSVEFSNVRFKVMVSFITYLHLRGN